MEEDWREQSMYRCISMFLIDEIQCENEENIGGRVELDWELILRIDREK